MASSRAGCMLAKILGGERIKPGGMYEWFDCHLPVCGGFHRVFPGCTERNTLYFLYRQTIDQNESLVSDSVKHSSLTLIDQKYNPHYDDVCSLTLLPVKVLVVGIVKVLRIKIFNNYKIFRQLEGHLFVCCLAHRGSTVGFPLLQCSSDVVRHPRDLQVSVAACFCRVLIFASS